MQQPIVAVRVSIRLGFTLQASWGPVLASWCIFCFQGGLHALFTHCHMSSNAQRSRPLGVLEARGGLACMQAARLHPHKVTTTLPGMALATGHAIAAMFYVHSKSGFSTGAKLPALAKSWSNWAGKHREGWSGAGAAASGMPNLCYCGSAIFCKRVLLPALRVAAPE